jgi:tRNA dimethylallyltransferase
MRPPNSIYSIVGPTASGKTELGVALALHLGNGEVVNCDSVQIYREIDIATAKPSVEEMRGVPHHLIGYVSATVNYTAADWARDAALKIAEIESRGAVPILVGGTGFYLRTLREPLFESPPTNPALRRRLRDLLEQKGHDHLHRILRRVDPASAGRLFPRDQVRVTRALEVYFQTGIRLSEAQPRRADPPEFAGRVRIFVLNPPRGELYARIDKRARDHFDAGLVDEVRELRDSGIPDGTSALGAHGYRRVCEYLRGERDLESAIEKTAQDVRNYAKRQLTWFRKEAGATWLEGFGSDPSMLEKLLAEARSETPK